MNNLPRRKVGQTALELPILGFGGAPSVNCLSVAPKHNPAKHWKVHGQQEFATTTQLPGMDMG